MAFTDKKYLSLMILMVVLRIFLFPLQVQSADCLLLSGCSHGKTTMQHSRKVLYIVKEKETVPITVTGSEITKEGHGYGKTIINSENNGKNNKLELGVELREAPASPDPLHHHGNKPGIMP